MELRYINLIAIIVVLILLYLWLDSTDAHVFSKIECRWNLGPIMCGRDWHRYIL